MEWVQISLFDPDSDVRSEREILLDKAIMRGSGFAGGPARIYAACLMMDQRQFVDFLREEFSVGGHSMDTDKGHGFVDYNGKGLKVRIWKSSREYEYSWQKVAARYRELIAMMMFPEEKIRRMVDEEASLKAPYPRMRYQIGGGDQ